MEKKPLAFFGALAPAAFFLLALGFLFFLAGAASLHYQWGPGAFLKMAFNGGDAWREKEKLFQNMQKSLPVRSGAPGKTAIYAEKKISTGPTLIVGENRASEAFLIGLKGRVLHRWHLPFSRAISNPDYLNNIFPDSHVRWQTAHVYPNGDLLALYQISELSPYGYGLAKLDKNSKLLWFYPDTAHHSLDVGPDGRIYTITQYIENKKDADFPKLRPPILADSVVVLSESGKQLKKIHLLDAFRHSEFKDQLKPRPSTEVGKGDYLHTNSIHLLKPDVNYTIPGMKPGSQVLLSIREQNMLAVLDIESEKIVWTATGAWRAQHSASFLPNGDIVLFDNLGMKNAIKNQRSRVLVIDPATQKTKWFYDRLWSRFGGVVQRLPNGNLLITESGIAKILEVSPDKKIVWKYKKRSQEGIAFGYRYSQKELPFLNP